MGIRNVEAKILSELRTVTGNKKLRQKDIMEWSTGEIFPEEGETLVRLPDLEINVVYKTQEKK